MSRFFSGPWILTGLAAIAVAGADGECRAGYLVTEYATLPETPMNLAFGTGGELFVGSSRTLGANTDQSWVYRVGPGGSPATRYGDHRLFDPDAILFDAEGTISGVAGSVIVGGVAPWNGVQNRGQLSAIRPDGTIQSLTSPRFTNPVQMAIDSTGRLLFTSQGERQGVFVAERGAQGLAISQLLGFDEPFGLPYGLAIGAGDLIYTSHADGRIRVHAPDGSLVDDAFATLFDPTGWPGPGRQTTLAFAPGGMFGTDLYATTSYADEILRIDPSGQATTILSGLGPISGMTFGPDGAMYLSSPSTRRILRVTPNAIPEPSSIVMVSLGAAAVVGLRLRRRGGRAGNGGGRAPRPG